jgi:hypothetical protein
LYAIALIPTNVISLAAVIQPVARQVATVYHLMARVDIAVFPMVIVNQAEVVGTLPISIKTASEDNAFMLVAPVQVYQMRA